MSAFTRVAIVDDEVDHAIICRMVLAQVAPGVAVEVFTDTHELEPKLLGLPPRTLVVIDRVLGRLESFGLVERLLAARDDLTVVLVSAALRAEDRQRALDAGAVQAAEKPGDLPAWRAFFSGLLEQGPDARPAVVA